MGGAVVRTWQEQQQYSRANLRQAVAAATIPIRVSGEQVALR